MRELPFDGHKMQAHTHTHAHTCTHIRTHTGATDPFALVRISHVIHPGPRTSKNVVVL